jgi:hypothetical protein
LKTAYPGQLGFSRTNLSCMLKMAHRHLSHRVWDKFVRPRSRCGLHA